MINCPNCGNEMTALHISGVEIDFCRNGCHGVWFDNYELVKLDEVHEGSGTELQEILSARRDDSTKTEKLICPKCELPMKRRKYKYGSDVEIDNCYSCNGIFLDSGELAAIRENYNHIQEASQEFIDKVDRDLKKHREEEGDPMSGLKGLNIISRLFGRG
jgi:Zn-finger nucleic acid-binding protein